MLCAQSAEILCRLFKHVKHALPSLRSNWELFFLPRNLPATPFKKFQAKKSLRQQKKFSNIFRVKSVSRLFRLNFFLPLCQLSDWTWLFVNQVVLADFNRLIWKKLDSMSDWLSSMCDEQFIWCQIFCCTPPVSAFLKRSTGRKKILPRRKKNWAEKNFEWNSREKNDHQGVCQSDKCS
jgi:hypothetical protein